MTDFAPRLPPIGRDVAQRSNCQCEMDMEAPWNWVPGDGAWMWEDSEPT